MIEFDICLAVDNGSWFDYVRDWEQMVKDNPEHPVHLLYYEDMKEVIILLSF